MKLYIWPFFGEADKGDGGVRRVVELQRAWLPKVGVDIVEDPAQADVLAAHISMPKTIPLRFPGKPLIAHCHGLYWAEFDWGANWYQAANEDVMETIRQADVVTAPSEWVAQAIRRHTCRDVRVVHHGIDLADWQSGRNAGYILWNKGRADAVCDAGPISELAFRMPDTRFVATYGQPGLDNLLVTGTLEFADAKRLIAEAGVYLATTKETFGIGILEALACGVPVVGWCWGGQAEILHHGEEAWLCQPGDLDSLRQGVEWALMNRERIAPLARARAADFAPEGVATAYKAIYEEALGQQQGRPKVSVTVRVYNMEQWLPECLDSVIAQTTKDWECIIIDDASTDSSGAIADDYANRDKRFRAVHNEANQYLAEAHNTAMAVAHGRYILPLDADDMLTPTALETLSGALDGDRSLHIAYGNVEFMESDGRRWHSGWPVEFRYDYQLRRGHENGRPPNLLPYSSMFRREVWEQTAGYRHRACPAEDADFWARAASYGFRPKMVTTQDTLIYRNHEGSSSRVKEPIEWTSWLPWASNLGLSPAGAVTVHQLPVPSFDPPAVSVIIPIGPGHERLLLDAIDSVEAQTFRQWECIVVNDTGSDLPRLPSWVRLLATVEGRGVAAARNVGIAAARAPLFVPLDADDYLQPEYLAAVIWAYRESGGDMVYTDFWEDHLEEGHFTLFKTPDSEPREVLLGALPVTMLLTKAGWEQVGGFDETLPSWEDWDFQFACHAKGLCFRRLAAPLWTYRKHTGRRRIENHADFDTGKQAMMGKWGKYWEGKTLMGCSSCGKKKTLVAQPARPRQGPSPTDGAVLLEYIGGKLGTMTFRGASGTIYHFGAGEAAKYVLSQDVPALEARVDFRRANGNRPDIAQAPETPAITTERAALKEAEVIG
jgi:glycosyltransferase involved in cell wall biosynthesis